MRKILIVVDMQNDFIDGSLGTPEAQAIVENVVEKIRSYPVEDVRATQDTHPVDYLSTQEGQKLPLEHCIKGTRGWEIRDEVAQLLRRGDEGAESRIYEKPTFGSLDLARDLQEIYRSSDEGLEIELVGLCTDICVVSNALLLKAFMPEVRISVAADCCAGVTPEKHQAALETMASCQIEIE
ncbi:MAG: cysteine hydrolase family protein [Anaerovoracaceae bacterium]|jgi:nicotinamidase/pyrazinamidase